MRLLNTAQLREAWTPPCTGPWVRVPLNGAGIVTVRPAILDAVRALDAVLRHWSYTTRREDTGAFACRRITGGTGYSLHAYGIALDINWNCLSGDTPVVTFDGSITLGEAVGRKIRLLTRDPFSGPTEPWWVDAEVDYFGERETFEVSTARGSRRSSIRATADHRWFVRRGGIGAVVEVHTRDLVAGDEVAGAVPGVDDMVVRAVEPAGVTDVYCPRVPETGAFVMSDWLLTGNSNPYRGDNKLITDMEPGMILDILALRTFSGAQVWGWGGNYRTIKDPQHFEIVCTPADLASGIRASSAPPSPQEDTMIRYIRDSINGDYYALWGEQFRRLSVDQFTKRQNLAKLGGGAIKAQDMHPWNLAAFLMDFQIVELKPAAT